MGEMGVTVHGVVRIRDVVMIKGAEPLTHILANSIKCMLMLLLLAQKTLNYID